MRLSDCQWSCRRLSPQARIWVGLDSVHLLHSCIVFLFAARHVLVHPQAWALSRKVSEGGSGEVLPSGSSPDVLICVVGGFLGFELFVIVQQRFAHLNLLHETIINVWLCVVKVHCSASPASSRLSCPDIHTHEMQNQPGILVA